MSPPVINFKANIVSSRKVVYVWEISTTVSLFQKIKVTELGVIKQED